MATKTELMSTTSVGSNMPVTTWEDDKIHRVVELGFADKKTADDKNGTAVQRVGCGVLAMYLSWMHSGHPDEEASVPNLGSILDTDTAGKDARKTKTELMRAEFIGDATNMDNAKPEDKAAYGLERARNGQTPTRAMRVACIAYRAGLTLDDFNDKAGCFSV